MLLCPNHHRAVHRCDAPSDWADRLRSRRAPGAAGGSTSKWLVAEADGRLNANRDNKATWERFVVTTR
ncbi:MAG: hypothetical protein R3F43_10170 [bacterium]